MFDEMFNEAIDYDVAEFTLSSRQQIAIELLNHPQVTDLSYGGGAGGGKSFVVAWWMLMQCLQYPGIRIGLGRKSLTRLKQTTLVTILREVHPLMGVKEREYKYSDYRNIIQYANGSQIQLVDLAYSPSDPDFDTLGSTLYTHIVIEEAGEINQKARTAFGSRKNRWLNDNYNITGKTVLTQNPSKNFTRDEFYEPYINLGGGTHRAWKSGHIEVDGKMLPAYKAFVKSLSIDNPFISRNYIETLKMLPQQERKRLLEGNWDYTDDNDTLITSSLIDTSMVSDLPEAGAKYIGVDVADKGNDKTVITLINNGVVTRQLRLNTKINGEVPISERNALELIKFAQQNGFTPSDAKNIAIESNGVGVGMRDFMRSKGWFITEYVATSKSRSAGYWKLRTALENNSLNIWSQLESLDELRKQITVMTYEFNENLEAVVMKKKDIKNIIGRSPDEADSLMIANWVKEGVLSDPRRNTSRIMF